MIGARGSSVSDSLRASWRLTAAIGAWPSLAIVLAGFVLPAVVGAFYGFVWGAAQTALARFDLAPARLDLAFVAAISFTAIYVVIMAYITQATQLSLCKWLKALEAARPAEPDQAAVA